MILMKELLKIEAVCIKRVNGLQSLIDSGLFDDDEILLMSIKCNLEIATINLYAVRRNIKMLELEQKRKAKRGF